MKWNVKCAKIGVLLSIMGISMLLCGCYAKLEPQNRNYIMCMGIDVSENGFRVSYSFPDLAMLTGTGEAAAEPVQTVEAESLSEAIRQLNARSDKIADYSQMPVLVIGDSVRRSQEVMQQVMAEAAAEKAIRRTVMVAYAKESAEELLMLDDKVNGSIGVFLYELGQNNYEDKGLHLTVLQDFLGENSARQCRIPVFGNEEDRPVLTALVKLPAQE